MLIRNRFFTVIILFLLTGCSSTTQPIEKSIPLVHNGGNGGNPEVRIHHCLQFRNNTKMSCLNAIYPENVNIVLTEHLALAGRGEIAQKETFNLQGQDRFILDIDTTNIKLPIDINIKNINKYQEGNRLIINIKVKEIGKEIILYNRDKKELLHFIINK